MCCILDAANALSLGDMLSLVAGLRLPGINLETPNSPGHTPLGTGAAKPQPFLSASLVLSVSLDILS